MYMKDLSTLLFSVSGGLTILYYTIKMFIENKSTTMKIITYLYYILLIGGVTSLVYSETKSICGESQWLYGFVYGILPWILIYGIFSLILELLPGWKSPFSNTFGYLYAKVRGVSDVINNLINTNYKSRDIQDIYNDPSLLVNTITPLNFTEAIKRLVNDKIFNPSGINYRENLTKLQTIVDGKDNISECIWKLLISGLISSMTASQIANIKCDYSVKQMQSNHSKHTAQQKENETQESNNKSKQYFIRD